VLTDVEKAVSDDPRQARQLPPEVYWAPEWDDYERDAVFLRSWLCVGRLDQIPAAGDYRTLDVAGEPLLVVRQANGTVAVMSNVCPHRANSVASGAGNCGDRFRCAYHSWTFGLDGRLIGAPEMREVVDLQTLRGEVRLAPAQVEVWEGFIFANFDRAAAPLAAGLHRMTDLIAPYDVGSMHTTADVDIPDMPWNWKILQENFLEPYHLTYLHADSHDFAPASATTFLPFEVGEQAIIRHGGFREIDGSLMATGWGKPALFPILAGLGVAERSRITWASIPPMMFIGLLPDMVLSYTMIPQSVDRMTLRINFCFPPDRFDDPDLEERCALVLSGSKTVVDQDVAVNSAVQRNLRSRFAVPGRFADKEQILARFHQWLAERYLSYTT
jgi:phenylpropionate dioxygenase-like ring-hydroxylating dioxygenase large terminal subunit